MLICVLTITITVALAWLYEHAKQKKIVYFFMVIIPTVIAGLRGVGTDYYGYALRYDKVLNGIKTDLDGTLLTGPFYKIITYVGKCLWGYQSVIFLIALFTIGIAFYIFIKMQDELSLVFSVFSYMTMFFLYSFNLFRQFLSAELFILALLFIREKRNRKYVAIVMVFSIIIHTSSIIYLLLFLLIPIIKSNNKIRICIYLCSIVVIVLIPLFASTLEKFTVIFSHYAYYFLHFRYMGLGLGICRYIILVWIPIFLITYKKNLFSFNIVSEYQEYVFFTMMGSILCLLSYVSNTFAYRIGYTGLCTLPIVLGIFIKRIRKNKQIAELGLAVAHILFFIYDFFYLNTGGVIPYEFFWR